MALLLLAARTAPTREAERLVRDPSLFSLSVVSVAVELFLHATGTFHWHYWWWNVASWPVIVIFGYLWFYLFAAWVYDAPSDRARWTRVGTLAGIDVLMGLVFGVALGWL